MWPGPVIIVAVLMQQVVPVLLIDGQEVVQKTPRGRCARERKASAFACGAR
jgi:hypothetical protein